MEMNGLLKLKSADGNIITFKVPQTIPTTIYYHVILYNMGNSISISQSIDLSSNQAFWGFNSATYATETTDSEMYRDIL